MLRDHAAYATLPVQDLDAARRFYEGVLGFRVLDASPGGVRYEAGDGSQFTTALSSGKSSGMHTQLGFWVTDIDAEVADLHKRGVKLLEYDTPGLKTKGGIAQIREDRAAWFLDPDGNMLGVIQFARVPTAAGAGSRGGRPAG